MFVAVDYVEFMHPRRRKGSSYVDPQAHSLVWLPPPCQIVFYVPR